MKRALSGLDLAAIVRELREAIKGARLVNIYQLDQNKFLFKLRSKGTTHRLLVELGRRAHLISSELEVPERPPPFCMGLRKDVRNAIVTDVRQRGLDRLLELYLATKEGTYKLVAELFREGNLVLVGPDGRIKRVLRPKEMRDRTLKPGVEFAYPPGPELDPSEPGSLDLSRLRELGQLEVVRGLARLTGLGGTYTEEVLARAGVDKGKPCDSLTDAELERLREAIAGLVSSVLEGPLDPHVVVSGGQWVDVVPVGLMRYAGLERVRFPTMNAAAEAYFTRLEAESVKEAKLRELSEEIRRLEEMLAHQQEALATYRAREEKFRRAGDLIFTHLHELNALLEEFRGLRERLGDWKAVRQALGELRSRGPPFSWLKDLRPSGPVLVLELEGTEIELDPRCPAQAAAAEYYERAKKARKKAEGAAAALEETRRRLEEARKALARAREAEVELAIPAPAFELPVRPSEPARKAWYERFRWFRSSDGFLVVAGKDAATNELLVKRYAEPGDLLLHAELPGAPFVLIKAGGREVPESTLEEAAQMAIAYSRAWKYGLGAATAICFKPEQAKKIGPHGEKLPKGTFYILGRKKYMRGVRPLLAIGVIRHEDRDELIVGPVKAVEAEASAHVLIGPGEVPARELVREAVRTLEARLGKLRLSKEELERAAARVPYGKGRLI